MTSLELGLVGNGNIAALIDEIGTVTWMCVPRVDGDPVFCSLLEGSTPAEHGYFGIELLGMQRSSQGYVANTPVLTTQLFDADGGAVEIIDFCPRFHQFDRIFCPASLVRVVRRVSGAPRIRVRLRPSAEYGRIRRGHTFGSHHIRYVDGDPVMRLTTDAPITYVLEEKAFVLHDTVALIFGPDESLTAGATPTAAAFLADTTRHWRDWVRSLAIPFEWQADVIRAAITLRLNAIEDTGAIVAAITTSIPESAGTARNWDYRFCWLRDAFMVVNALNRLGATHTMERYLDYIVNIAAGSEGGRLQPVYGINGRTALLETEIPWLAGYRDMGPVRVGNLAYEQVQHDVYGSVILSVAHIFFDQRLVRSDAPALFAALEPLGEHAAKVYDRADSGIWEFRGRSEPHTFSAAMCWAACDRLARIARRLNINDRADYWRSIADDMRQSILRRAWRPDGNYFSATLDGDRLDASLLLLHEIGFVPGHDPRFATTVDAVARSLRRGDFVFRYATEDDFGAPTNAFLVCTFWYIAALAAIGRRDEARALFGRVLTHRNRLGLMAEHIDPATHEQWGNFVQTYSMVGQIVCAIRLSESWDQAF
jgi:GH15 family glucan-1,4-alpha-glucosidase